MHIELLSQDLELIRSFESMSFENEQEDEWSSSLAAAGSLSGDQTVKAMEQAMVGGAPNWKPQMLPSKKDTPPNAIDEAAGAGSGFLTAFSV